MSFSEAIKSCLTKYVDFSGVASRSEYWFFALFLFLCYLGAIILSAAANSVVLLVLFILALILPSLAAQIRRLRDGGFSPWLALLNLIPYLGAIALIVLCCQPSKPNSAAADASQQTYSALNQYCGTCGTFRSLNEAFCKSCGSRNS
jgi:uncharacterized membrane protein YhaH (DUF805 family)